MTELTIAQVAERLGVNVSRVSAIIKSGRLPARTEGRRRFISAEDLAAYEPLPVGWQLGRSRKQGTRHAAQSA